MTRSLKQTARVLLATVAEIPELPMIAPPLDINDARIFPNIAAARAHYASLSPERRAELDKEWT